MRTPVLALALGAMISTGCFTVQPPAAPPAPATVSAWGPLGGFAVNYGNCAGHVTLVNGFATVTDPCFEEIPENINTIRLAGFRREKLQKQFGDLRTRRVKMEV